DPVSNSWGNSTPIPDFGTFGGVGGICGDHIVYADGVADTTMFSFDLVNRVLVGAINPADPTQITWEDRGPHPGAAVYRGASWNLPGDPTRVLFAGGTDNPYNFDGIGYDGNPSEPLGQVWSYHVATGTVVFHENKPVPTMDHRGWPAGGGGRLWIVGGMEAGQQVTDRVSSWLPDAVTASPLPLAASLPEIRAFPSPARHRIRFAAAGGAPLENPRIVDVSGRTVRSWPGTAPADLSWNLKERNGTRVAAGVYWITAKVRGRTAARSVVVLAP
ncbi:MAG: hypothetical protein HKN12_03810, partial [Gemmatimonadetes bacterium]|nr:hypothetical protein [Gemmatimonadota bacterium]